MFRRSAAPFLILAAALGAGLGACAPSNKPPIEYSVREFTVTHSLRDVFGRLQEQMNGCPSVNSLLWPPEVVGNLERDRRSGRVAMVQRRRGGDEVLWGANLAAVEGGTKMSVFTARHRGIGNVEWLMRAWAEGRDPERNQDGFDFVIC
jgi:hypothetical protein